MTHGVGHADAVVRNGEHDGVRVGHMSGRHLNEATIGQRIARVDEQVHEQLLELSAVGP